MCVVRVIPMVNTDDGEWQRRCQRRHLCLQKVKTEESYLEMRVRLLRAAMDEHQKFPRPVTPDPDDRLLSKRDWEKAMMDFRVHLRIIVSELN